MNNENHLYVFTIVKKSDKTNIEDFIRFKDNVESKFRYADFNPVILFFTDVKNDGFESNGINALPFKKGKGNCGFNQILRKDIKIPENAILYYIPFGLMDFNVNLKVSHTKVENPDGTIIATYPIVEGQCETSEKQDDGEDVNQFVDLVGKYISQGVNSVIYNEMHQEKEVVDDIALIQCFYGLNPTEIRSVSNAIEFNLRMTRIPSTWVFIEAQKKKDDCVFKWLKNYGIRYRFVQMDVDGGVSLTNILWNIGAESCEESRLCFVDSDVVMCNSDWIEKAAQTFDFGYDVISLASHQYWENDESELGFAETIGMSWLKKHELSGNPQMTIGMTRKSYGKIKGFSPAFIDDCEMDWSKVFGRTWNDARYAPRFQIGYSEGNVACHLSNFDLDMSRTVSNYLSDQGMDKHGEFAGFSNRKLSFKSKSASKIDDALRKYHMDCKQSNKYDSIER